ncbi:MAG: hypothetical protein ABSF77_18560 [Spirochaetia bacterium]|jgi:hypothetical protein
MAEETKEVAYKSYGCIYGDVHIHDDGTVYFVPTTALSDAWDEMHELDFDSAEVCMPDEPPADDEDKVEVGTGAGKGKGNG